MAIARHLLKQKLTCFNQLNFLKPIKIHVKFSLEVSNVLLFAPMCHPNTFDVVKNSKTEITC